MPPFNILSLIFINLFSIVIRCDAWCKESRYEGTDAKAICYDEQADMLFEYIVPNHMGVLAGAYSSLDEELFSIYSNASNNIVNSTDEDIVGEHYPRSLDTRDFGAACIAAQCDSDRPLSIAASAIEGLSSMVMNLLNPADIGDRLAQSPRSVCMLWNEKNVCVSWNAYQIQKMTEAQRRKISNECSTTCAINNESCGIRVGADGATNYYCVSSRPKGCTDHATAIDHCKENAKCRSQN